MKKGVSKGPELSKFFSCSYFEAREKFRLAAAEAGADLHSLSIQAKGPSGEGLSIDIADLGPKDSPEVILHVSGVHGVEGYAGSAVQLAILDDLSHRPLPDGVRVVFVHILNPWGMAHGRRVNEDNVDLNRNFGELTGSPGLYKKLDPFLNPARWPTAPFLFEAAGKILRHGFRPLAEAIASGQHEYPRGLFYGGERRSESTDKFLAWASSNLSSAKKIHFVDFHTGLGRYGESLELRLWGGKKEGKSSYIPSGTTTDGLERILLGRGIAQNAVTQEIGIKGSISTLKALRRENFTHHHLRGTREDLTAKDALRQTFAPSAPGWRQNAVKHGVIVFWNKIRNIELTINNDKKIEGFSLFLDKDNAAIHGQFTPLSIYKNQSDVKITIWCSVLGQSISYSPSIAYLSPIGFECDMPEAFFGELCNIHIQSGLGSIRHSMFLNKCFDLNGQELWGGKWPQGIVVDGRWSFADRHMIKALIKPDFVFKNDLYISIRSYDAKYMTIETSFRNKWIIPGSTLPVKAEVLDFGAISFSGLVVATKEKEGVLHASIELINLDKKSKRALGQYAAIFSSHSTAKEIQESGLGPLSAAAASTWGIVSSISDYEQVLNLREAAYKRVKGEENWRTMGDDYDRHALIMIGKKHNEVIGTARIIPLASSKKSEYEAFVSLPSWLPRDETIEVSRVCTRKNERRSGVLHSLFVNIAIYMVESNNRWIVGSCKSDLSSLYIDLGAKFTGDAYKHSSVGDDDHYLFTIDVRSLLIGRGLSYDLWMPNLKPVLTKLRKSRAIRLTASELIWMNFLSLKHLQVQAWSTLKRNAESLWSWKSSSKTSQQKSL